jgi:predicted DNA-binding transcriptional regulator AlpA
MKATVSIEFDASALEQFIHAVVKQAVAEAVRTLDGVPPRARHIPGILRKRAVIQRTGLSDTTIWRLERAGRFPKSIRLSGNAVGWREAEIDQWIKDGKAPSK